MNYNWHVVTILEGVVVSLILTEWIGLPFFSWDFWGPFITICVVTTMAERLR